MPKDGQLDWVVTDCGAGAGAYQVKMADAADPNCTGFSEMFNSSVILPLP